VKGDPISLSDFIGRQNLVLVFYRGSFSTTSIERLRELQKSYARIRKLGAEVIAVSAEGRNTALRTAAELRLAYPVVADIALAKLYGAYDANTLLSRPAVFLVDRSGRIRWKHIGRGPLDRPPISRILAELQNL
ncbi:MAG: redoxin domain-containing protein, partial [Nitrospinota bacterium]